MRPDPDFYSVEKDYSFSKVRVDRSNLLFPPGTSKHWIVRMDNPPGGVISKAQVVDYYVQNLMKVLGK